MTGKPIDLTTIGAAVPLPPRDHSIFKDGSASDYGIPEMTPDEMRFRICNAEKEIARLWNFIRERIE